MLVPTLLSAGFALTANAFLLPPEVVNKAEAAKNSVPPTLINPQVRTVSLDCSNCPFALASQRNGRHEWTNSVKSDIELKFAAEDDKLKLNGVPFYPVVPPFAPAPLSVKQTPKSGGTEATSDNGFDGDLTLSYSLEIGDKKKGLPTQGVVNPTMTEITLSILGLDNEVVHVDDIKIKALSLPNPANGKHELFIVGVNTEATDGSSPDAQCATIFCRVLYKFRSGVRKAQTHAKTAAYKVKCICMKCFNAMKKHASRPVRLPTHNRVRPGHFKIHRHHHSWVHTFARASKQVFSFVVLPILVGIVFGIAASAIGMLVGQVIVTIWLRLRRNSNQTVAYERVETEEKEGLPKYEDLEDGKTEVDEKA
ncbi:MAG: hypothetical protein LQ343_004883 [Gyalolechia ehrenbergii]|nr:MAG: hypothetical protein LQ343_004883 [Gyalolechia ehrenbergii]